MYNYIRTYVVENSQELSSKYVCAYALSCYVESTYIIIIIIIQLQCTQLHKKYKLPSAYLTIIHSIITITYTQKIHNYGTCVIIYTLHVRTYTVKGPMLEQIAQEGVLWPSVTFDKMVRFGSLCHNMG